MHSTELRQRIHELETAAERSAAAVRNAQDACAAALKAAVLNNDHDAAERAESVLKAARITHSRTLALVEEARTCLAAALRAEKAQAQAQARAEIDAELAAMAEDASDIDGAFAALVSRVVQLRARELALRSKVRQSHREAHGGPEYFSALRSTASYLSAVASGILEPAAPASIARAVASGSRAIKVAIDGE